jgi:acetyl-CoA C-acetyltransferase
MGPTYLASTAMTPFGRSVDSLSALAVSAGAAALEESGLGPSDIGCLYMGTFLGQSLELQGVLASLVARELGLPNIPATTVEGACASAGIALRHGSMAVASGSTRAALCIGAEKLTSHPLAEVTAGLGEALDRDTDQRVGLTFAGFFGLVASAHAARYGSTRRDLAAVSVKNRGHGASNPLAMFRTPVGEEDVSTSRPIADPLRLLDCSPISDGAAAAVVTSERPAASPIGISACEQASGAVSLRHIDDLTTFPATTTAAAAAFARADLRPADVDVVELHDCFTIAEIIDTEDLGLLPRGEAAAAISDGVTGWSTGGLVVNPSGGLLSRGHPVGATGLAQIHELRLQLTGAAPLQHPNAEVGLAHNLGGCGATATVTILTKDRG